MVGGIGGLSGGHGVLVSGARCALSAGDSSLGSLVGIHDIAMGSGGFGVEIVGLRDKGGGLRTNVVLGRATYGECNNKCAGEEGGAGRFYPGIGKIISSHSGAHMSSS